MPVTHAYQQQFKDKDFSHSVLAGEFEECAFVGCNLANTDLTSTKFIDCVFEQCDLSLAQVPESVWQEVRFVECKLLGIRFDQSNPFLLALEFTKCQLDLASFEGLRFRQLRFEDCALIEVDFTLADLKGVTFKGCDMTRAIFDRTILEKADLTTALNYTIDPENNLLRGAKFSAPEVLRLLDKYQLKID